MARDPGAGAGTPGGLDCDDCPFCEGRYAAEDGKPENSNPYPVPDAPTGSDEYWRSDWALWDTGYGVGSIDWKTVKVYRPDEAWRKRHGYEGELQ